MLGDDAISCIPKQAERALEFGEGLKNISEILNAWVRIKLPLAAAVLLEKPEQPKVPPIISAAGKDTGEEEGLETMFRGLGSFFRFLENVSAVQSKLSIDASMVPQQPLFFKTKADKKKAEAAARQFIPFPSPIELFKLADSYFHLSNLEGSTRVSNEFQQLELSDLVERMKEAIKGITVFIKAAQEDEVKLKMVVEHSEGIRMLLIKGNALLKYALSELREVSDLDALLHLTKIGRAVIKTYEGLKKKAIGLGNKKKSFAYDDNLFDQYKVKLQLTNEVIPFVLSIHVHIAYMLAFRNDEPSSLSKAIAEYYLALATEFREKYAALDFSLGAGRGKPRIKGLYHSFDMCLAYAGAKIAYGNNAEGRIIIDAIKQGEKQAELCKDNALMILPSISFLNAYFRMEYASHCDDPYAAAEYYVEVLRFLELSLENGVYPAPVEQRRGKLSQLYEDILSECKRDLKKRFPECHVQQIRDNIKQFNVFFIAV